MLNAKNILVPTDFSPYADKALDLAVDVAKHNNARIYLLHVIDPIQRCAADYCLDDGIVREIEQRNRSETIANFKKETERFKNDRVKIVQDIQEGAPYDEIIKEQKAKHADLIVMSAHKRKGLKKYLVGSVADRVMKTASCDVVIVKS